MHEDIIKARKELGLSQVKLAEKAGIARARLQDLENGKNVTVETVRRVVAQLPNLTMNLKWATPPKGQEAEIQQALYDIINGATSLLRLFHLPLPGEDPQRERIERLRRMAELIEAGKAPIEEEH